ncbi:MAG: hypothetical protein ACREVM_09235, partial [Burkholderiales bacterium]
CQRQRGLARTHRPAYPYSQWLRRHCFLHLLQNSFTTKDTKETRRGTKEIKNRTIRAERERDRLPRMHDQKSVL